MFGLLRRRPFVSAFTVLFFSVVGFSAVGSPYPAERVNPGGVFIHAPLRLGYLFMIWIFSVIPRPVMHSRTTSPVEEWSASQRVIRCAKRGSDLLIDFTRCRHRGKIVSAA